MMDQTQKSGLKPKKNSKPEVLTFKLAEQEKGFIAMCCSSKKCAPKFMKAKPDFYLDDKLVESTKPIWQGKCIQIREKFDKGNNKSAKTLGIDLNKAQKDTPAVTHIISH